MFRHESYLCVHGGMQREEIDFNNTFSHDVNWSTVRLIIMMDGMAVWESIQIDYVLAFPQLPIDSDVYLHLPTVFRVDGEDKNKTYFLMLKKNIYKEVGG